MFDQLVTNVKETIIKPSVAFPRLANECDIKLAALVLIIVSVISGLAEGATAVISGILVMSAFWVLETGVLHLLAKIFGATGEMKRLLIVNAYTMVPSLFFIPLSLIPGGEMMTLAIGGIWTMYLSYLALKSVYTLSAGKAIIILVLLYFILAVLGVLMAFAMMRL